MKFYELMQFIPMMEMKYEILRDMKTEIMKLCSCISRRATAVRVVDKVLITYDYDDIRFISEPPFNL